MLYDDYVREKLFLKAGLNEDRDLVLQILADQETLYERYDCFNEVAEVKRIRNDFLNQFPPLVEADKICENAAKLINEGQIAAALQLLNNGDVRYGNKTTLSILYGMIFYIAGKYDDAKDIVEKALNRTPDNKDLMTLLEQITGSMR